MEMVNNNSPSWQQKSSEGESSSESSKKSIKKNNSRDSLTTCSSENESLTSKEEEQQKETDNQSSTIFGKDEFNDSFENQGTKMLVGTFSNNSHVRLSRKTKQLSHDELPEKNSFFRTFSQKFLNFANNKKKKKALKIKPLQSFTTLSLSGDLSGIDRNNLAKKMMSLLKISRKHTGTANLSVFILTSIQKNKDNHTPIVKALSILRANIDQKIEKKKEKPSKFSILFSSSEKIESKLKKKWIEKGFCKEMAALVLSKETRSIVISFYFQQSTNSSFLGDIYDIVNNIFEFSLTHQEVLELIIFFTQEEKDRKSGPSKKQELFREKNFVTPLSIKYSEIYLMDDLKKFKDLIRKFLMKFYNVFHQNISLGQLAYEYNYADHAKTYFSDFLSAFYEIPLSQSFLQLLRIRKVALSDQTMVSSSLIFEIIGPFLTKNFTGNENVSIFTKLLNLISLNQSFETISSNLTFIDANFFNKSRSNYLIYINKIENEIS